jgi:hypothetical protein
MSLVVALSAGVAACDSGPGGGTAQRDVYAGPNALQNCIADWGNEELCKQQLSDEEKKKLGGHSRGAPGVFLWGPSYFGANRTVTHKGVTYTPTATHAVRTAAFDGNLRPVSFSAPRPAGTSARGGFGATGSGVGTSGS